MTTNKIKIGLYDYFQNNAGILEVVGQSVEDMHVLNKQTDSGCRNETSIGKIKSHESVSNESSRIQVEPQTVKDPNAVLKEMERSLIDYSEVGFNISSYFDIYC